MSAAIKAFYTSLPCLNLSNAGCLPASNEVPARFSLNEGSGDSVATDKLLYASFASDIILAFLCSRRSYTVSNRTGLSNIWMITE